MATNLRSSPSSAAAEGKDGWEVAGRRFTSRLIVGTGKYKSFEQNAAAVEASGAEIVTVAVRRLHLVVAAVLARADDEPRGESPAANLE